MDEDETGLIAGGSRDEGGGSKINFATDSILSGRNGAKQ